MAKPVIMTVDDEPQVLNAIDRDLRRHYRREYRVIKASSGQEALDAVKELKKRNDPVAVLLADQRMPGMEGTDFLTEAIKFYPEAKKVLLTAYADTQAAIDSINSIGLDHYLIKPWDPPDQNLYPVLDDLLDDWVATVPVPYDGIRVAGTLWSASSHRVKDFLARNRMPYQWLDIEEDPQAQELVDSVRNGDHRLPVVFMADGSTLIDPENRELAQACGLQTEASQKFSDMIVVGGGPAGLGAAVYATSEGLRVAVIEREATGGQAGTSALIENYLGFPSGLSGADLARRATTQAQRFGAEILTSVEVDKVRVDQPYKYVTLNDGTELSCFALMVSTGVSVRKLPVPGVEKLTGAGVYYSAAVTEAVNYKGQDVFVVGGANSAGQGVMLLSKYARKVNMLVQGDALEIEMSQYLVDLINETENIEVLVNTETVEVNGEDRLESVLVKDTKTGETRTLEGAAMFIFIGAAPRTELVDGVVERDEAGFIITGDDLIRRGRRPRNWTLDRDPYLLETNVPGIFAAGDVRFGAVARVASAVGQGSMAVSFVHKCLASV